MSDDYDNKRVSLHFVVIDDSDKELESDSERDNHRDNNNNNNNNSSSNNNQQNNVPYDDRSSYRSFDDTASAHNTEEIFDYSEDDEYDYKDFIDLSPGNSFESTHMMDSMGKKLNNENDSERKKKKRASFKRSLNYIRSSIAMNLHGSNNSIAYNEEEEGEEYEEDEDYVNSLFTELEVSSNKQINQHNSSSLPSTKFLPIPNSTQQQSHQHHHHHHHNLLHHLHHHNNNHHHNSHNNNGHSYNNNSPQGKDSEPILSTSSTSTSTGSYQSYPMIKKYINRQSLGLDKSLG